VAQADHPFRPFPAAHWLGDAACQDAHSARWAVVTVPLHLWAALVHRWKAGVGVKVAKYLM
jgi:hypothetical protein